MRIFWLNGGLQLMPENERERIVLSELVPNIKLGEPPEIQAHIPGGQCDLGSDGLFESIIGNQQARPRSFAGKSRDKQPIICINKLPQ